MVRLWQVQGRVLAGQLVHLKRADSIRSTLTQLKLFQYGERLIDRIDFEELALKSVDPSLGPTISHPDISREEKPLVKVGNHRDRLPQLTHLL